MSPTLKSTGGGSLCSQIWGCSPWSRPMMFGCAESEHPMLTKGEIISDVFQFNSINSILLSNLWSQSTNVTDRRTDRETDDMRSRHWKQENIRSPAGTTAEYISGGHHGCGVHQIEIFPAVVPAGLRKTLHHAVSLRQHGSGCTVMNCDRIGSAVQ